jgi:hypothetical protein
LRTGYYHLEAGRLERQTEHPAHLGVVVDQENAATAFREF